MKKITTILMVLIISNVYAGFFEGVQNPHGRPGLLSIKYSDLSLKTSHGHGAIEFTSFDEEYANEPFYLEFHLPVTNYLTFNWEISPITSTFGTKEKYRHLVENIYEDDDSSYASSVIVGHSHEGEEIVFVNLHKVSFELHIPLYKIWEK